MGFSANNIVVLPFVAVLSFILGTYLPLDAKSFLYTVSVTIKSFVMFILPFVIFTLIAKGVLNLKSRTFIMATVLVIMICLSNFTSAWVSYAISILITSYLPAMEEITRAQHDSLELLWMLEIPRFIDNIQAIAAGLIFGILLLLFAREKWISKIMIFSQNFSDFILKRIMMPVIPVFIAGFIINISHSGELAPLITRCFYVLLSFILATSLYLKLIYLILMGKNFMQIRNMIPACMTGFSTMSSMLAIPMLIDAAAENTKNRDLVEPIIPSTVNFHLIGDCFFIPMVALFILQMSGLSSPDASDYLIFSLQFVIAKFSVAAVPSGGIIVMLPLLEQSSFNFDSSMLSIITVLYALFDPLITSFNVMGNGALAIAFTKIYSLLSKRLRKRGLSPA